MKDVSRDARLAQTLAGLPPYRRWENRPLPPQLREMLRELDQQTLMTVAAYTLHRVMAGEDHGRKAAREPAAEGEAR